MLIAAGAHVGVVEQVVDGEVEAEAAAVLQTDVATYVEVHEEAALHTGLLGGLCLVDAAVLVVEDAAIGGQCGLVDSEAGVAIGIYSTAGDVGCEDVAQATELREVYIYAVVVVDVGTKEPTVHVVVDAEAQGGERSAAHAASVGNHEQGILLLGGGVGVGHAHLVLALVGDGGIGVVGVEGVAHRTDEGE